MKDGGTLPLPLLFLFDNLKSDIEVHFTIRFVLQDESDRLTVPEVTETWQGKRQVKSARSAKNRIGRGIYLTHQCLTRGSENPMGSLTERVEKSISAP